jgi:hypothetical protein
VPPPSQCPDRDFRVQKAVLLLVLPHAKTRGLAGLWRPGRPHSTPLENPSWRAESTARLVAFQMEVICIKARHQMPLNEIPEPQTVGSWAVKLDKKGVVFGGICLLASLGHSHTPSVIAVLMMQHPRRFVPQDEGHGHLTPQDLEIRNRYGIPVHERQSHRYAQNGRAE